MLQQAKRLLKEYYGYDDFRDGQTEIIERILSGRDTLGILPTGGGKSITYQIPALILDGVTLVISPLISLMKDQVDSLNQAGVSAVYINSTLSYQEVEENMNLVVSGECKLLYLAPERLESPHFMDELTALPISLIAIDEAHCISQWGHDFRPSYLRLTSLFERFSDKPRILALTATATPQVRLDICRSLHIGEEEVIMTGFARTNLSFQLIKGQDRLKFLQQYLKKNATEAGIIYAATRKNVEQLYERLRKAGISAGRYHAGLSAAERDIEQDKFVNDEIQVMVATNAFGMGIDKSNVRYTIHFQVPKNMESYYQEAGRAGRDGLPSECILLFSEQDVQLQRFLIDQSESIEHKQNELAKLQSIREYCYTENCLQGFILGYFGEDEWVPCGRCSNCLDNRSSVDVTRDAQIVLSCIKRMNERFGKTMVAQVLTGSSNKKVGDFGFQSLSTFGLMKERTVKDVSEFIDYLCSEQYIGVSGGQFPLLNVTEKGVGVLKGAGSVQRKESIQVQAPSLQGDPLFEHLRGLRKEIASAEGVPPFVIFSDVTLREMCMRQPKNLDEMGDVKGVGAQKLEKYGSTFLKGIEDFLLEHPDHEPAAEEMALAEPKKKKSASSGNSYLESYEKFKNGADIKAIALERDMTVNTVENHLAKAAGEGLEFSTEELYTAEQALKIQSAVQTAGREYLKPIKEQLADEDITYFMIKMWLEFNK
ncbi:DNA helicase RecQ [Peribacillus sp. SCS-37]|uniref:DNA helicase RecQ n=1 Tax=Paraperibacillus esterisolvens TaxID=3115296 RepID=UPI003905FB56